MNQSLMGCVQGETVMPAEAMVSNIQLPEASKQQTEPMCPFILPGAFHFYEYNKVCAVCRDAVFDTPVRYRCSGPPCKIMIQGDCTKNK